MITMQSLATDTNNTYDIAFTSVARSMTPTTPAPTTLLSLEQYMSAILDDTQRATRAALATPSMPPSGRGSDHDTIPAPYGVEAA